MMDAGRIAVLAEKPSVARDIARVLGATSRGEGYLHGNGYVVTWAIGHLAALAQPHEIRPEWRAWRRDLLPMLPREWPLVVYEKTKDQFEIVRKILRSPRISRVICATDAGREGELIFRYIYEAAGSDKPVGRLWISSLTPDAIRKGFDTVRPGSDYDHLADAARGRSRADWLVGMNLSRAYTLACGDELSVGRVQTPTLAMVVERELAIRSFVPEDYLEVNATFRPAGKPDSAAYEGVWFRPPGRTTRLPVDVIEAGQIVERARSGRAAIESIEAETQRMAPPLMYDLTDLQRHANRLFGFSAQKTLDLAQALYERHKLISYPRTDSRYLSRDVAATLPQIVRTVEGSYREHLAPGTGERPLGRRFVDDSKVRDHHAIIPTITSPQNADPSADERRIYDLICRRLLAAWQPDYVWSVTTVITAITSGTIVDQYHSSGTVVDQVGWKVLDVATGQRGSEPQEEALPAGLAQGQPQDVIDAGSVKKKTRAPRRFTEATLLTAMEAAGKTLDEKELSDAMKDSGLGTPATRAAIIEVLLKRGYIVRAGKNLEATDKGIRLIDVVHSEVKSPAMTGQWEAYLKRIERGEAQLEPFLHGIEDYVREVVGKVGQNGLSSKSGGHLETGGSAPPAVPAPALPDEPLDALLHRTFGFESFRANQEAVCRTVIQGRDVLLVMPTGSGKSLCYQLPAVALGGTTLVISPLIALMEDQFAKLRELGFAVECIHSGRDRAASRQVAIDYLNGRLQFLFIAPERLRVRGFPEMLARCKPSLVAIDEAHCISQWGHDFRPDYRLLHRYLPTFRPAPVIALTATATPVVQRDIREQLDLERPASFIHGFRRSNIAIEVVEISAQQRPELVKELLADASRRPAIVYTPTRKQAQSVADLINETWPAAAYHAGLDAERRHRVQHGFLEGKTEVIVATIAFGMGIDKPDIRTIIHTALPGSIEAYYQEIGRAGRDGEMSRALLMHSYADRYTHDFFFERDYPDVRVLDAIFEQIGPNPVEKAILQKKVRALPDIFDKALEKLWTHGGALIDASENVSRGEEEWRESYTAQGERKRMQIDQMIRYAQSNHCRMSSLVLHFGDYADSQKPCGICDFCAPANCIAQAFRPATQLEERTARQVLEELRGTGQGRSAGQLYLAVCPNANLSRDEFEEVIGAMARAGLVKLTESVFEKEGKQIPFRKVSITRDGEAFDEPAIELAIKGAAPAPPGAAGRSRVPRGTKRKKKRGMKISETSPPEEKLRAWRLAVAKRMGVPAFRIMTDRVLIAIAEARPRTAAELLAIPGIGLKTVEQHGAQIYRIVDSGQ
jgi:DNA topoisomerase-3